MMKHLIEYLLHDGYVPYFVEQQVPNIVGTLRYYGLSKDSASCYIPDTLTTYTKQEFVNKLTTMEITKFEPEALPRPMTKDEKIIFINEWINKAFLTE